MASHVNDDQGALSYSEPERIVSLFGRFERARLRLNATRRQVIRAFAIVAAIVAVFFVVENFRDRQRAASVFKQVLTADYQNLPELFPKLDSHIDRLRPQIERLEHDPTASVRDRGAALLLLYRDQPTFARGAALRSRLREGRPEEVSLIRGVLAVHPAVSGAIELRNDLFDETEPLAARLRFACALAELKSIYGDDWKPVTPALALALLDEDRGTVSRWLNLLGPFALELAPSLRQICSDRDRDALSRVVAAEILAEDLASFGDTADLARTLIEVQPEASLVLLRKLESLQQRASFLYVLRDSLAKAPIVVGDDALVERHAAAVVAMAVLGDPDPLRAALRHHEDPSLRTRAIQKIATLGLATRTLHGAEWAELDPAQRQGVLLAWAETAVSRLLPVVRDEIVKTARDRYDDDPDPGVHSAAELLLRRWGHADQLSSTDEEKHKHPSPASGRGWETGPNGHTFAILPGRQVFQMGSPENEPERSPSENRHYRRINRTIAVATTEVTVAQFRRFESRYLPDPRYAREPGCPAGGVSWYEALRYCNWLSKQDGLRPDQCCYPVAADIKEGMMLPADAFDRPGYRLPSEAEWEYFCRGGTETCRPWGGSEDFLGRYAWTGLNSRGRSAPEGRLLPNEFGLFDTVGSLSEWCHDGPTGSGSIEPYPQGTDKEHPAADKFQSSFHNTGGWRIIRGGVFDGGPPLARSAHREIYQAGSARYSIGFRVVRTVVEATEASE